MHVARVQHQTTAGFEDQWQFIRSQLLQAEPAHAQCVPAPAAGFGEKWQFIRSQALASDRIARLFRSSYKTAGSKRQAPDAAQQVRMGGLALKMLRFICP